MAGLEAAEGSQVFGREFGGEGVPGAGHVLGGHVDDALGEPVLAVGHGQEFRVGSQAGAAEGAGGEEGRILAEESGGVGIAVQGGQDLRDGLGFGEGAPLLRRRGRRGGPVFVAGAFAFAGHEFEPPFSL